MKPNDNYLIRIENLSFMYDKAKTIFENLNLHICEGDVIGIKGDSGVGKSTFCNILCGIIPNNVNGILTGDVYFGEKNIKNMNIAQISTYVSIVFQNAKNQFFAPTLEENLAFAPENLKLTQSEIEKRVVESLELVGLSDYRYFSPFKLSGGQQHLAAIASIITLSPSVVILDETMASLDNKSKDIVFSIVSKLKSEGKAIIMVEHEESSFEICNKIMMLKDKTWEICYDRT